MISVFDLFSVGIGPSSSHTVGPMRAALMFTDELSGSGVAPARVRVELFGSLGATGHGHGTVKAVILGLLGYAPETVDPRATGSAVQAVYDGRSLRLPSGAVIDFDPDVDIVLHRRKRLDFHTNGMRLFADAADGTQLLARTYFSVGGGFVLGEDEAGRPAVPEPPVPDPRSPPPARHRPCQVPTGPRRMSS